jgi:hypothetical protein
MGGGFPCNSYTKFPPFNWQLNYPFAVVAGEIRTPNHTGMLNDTTGGFDSDGMAIWGPHSLFHTTE